MADGAASAGDPLAGDTIILFADVTVAPDAPSPDPLHQAITIQHEER
jgi:hypothetical protein